MGDMINISKVEEQEFLKRFECLINVIPENMPEEPINPLIKYIKEKDQIMESLFEFFYHSEYLELLTPEILSISIYLYDKNADTEWFEILLFMMEEKDKSEPFCKLLSICYDANIDTDSVREMITTSVSAADMYLKISEHIKKSININNDMDDTDKDVNNVLQKGQYFFDLYNEQKQFVAYLLHEIMNLQKEISNLNFEKEQRKDNAEVEKSRDLIKTVSDENDKLKLRQKELISEIEKVCLEKDLFERQLQIAIKGRESVYIDMMEQKRSVLNYKLQAERLEKKISDVSEMEKENSDLKSSNSELQNEIILLQEQQDKLQTEISGNQNTVRELNRIISSKDAEIAEYQKIIEKYKIELENLKKSLADKDMEREFSKEEKNVTSQSKIMDVTAEIITQEIEDDEEVEFPNTQIISFKSGINEVKKKSNWFMNLLLQYSKKVFLKNSRQDQESLIYIKMMEMHYEMEKMQKVKKSLNEKIPCFELYKLICKDPTLEELDKFFSSYDTAYAE